MELSTVNAMYSSIVGSRSYGVQSPNSDTDIVMLGRSSDSPQFVCEGKPDLRPSSLSRFQCDMLGPEPQWFFTQWLFPESFLEDSVLSEYILENRDAIIQARLPIVYKTLKQRADGLHLWGDRLYKTHPKRLVYSTLFYSMLANHANGMAFAEAHSPKGELHDLLVGMRLGQVTLEDAVSRNELERQRAEKAAGFYKDAVHPVILREFEQVILEEAEKVRLTHPKTQKSL